MTRILSSFSRLRACAGLSASSKMASDAPLACASSRTSAVLPLPMKVRGSGAFRRWRTVAATSAPALSVSACSSSSDSSLPIPGSDWSSIPTRIALSWCSLETSYDLVSALPHTVLDASTMLSHASNSGDAAAPTTTALALNARAATDSPLKLERRSCPDWRSSSREDPDCRRTVWTGRHSC